jgi:hypothetical protein
MVFMIGRCLPFTASGFITIFAIKFTHKIYPFTKPKTKRMFLRILSLLLLVTVTACGRSPQPISGLWEVPIQTSTPQPPTKTPIPTITPVQEPPIIVTPTAGEIDEAATFFLTVIVEDEYGRLQEAMVTISWADGREALTFGPTFDIKIPVQASSSPFLLTVEKENYQTVRQPFEVSLSEDMQYEFTATMLPAEDFAHVNESVEA